MARREPLTPIDVSEDPGPRTASPRRRRLLIGLTLALPWLLLALLEGGLRAGGYGESYPLVVPYPAEPSFHFLNERIGHKYFRGAFVPSARLDFFHAAKPPGAVRIVFQGESSAAGFPYGHGGAPSQMLEQRLQATFPDRRIEVVNTAMTAVSSYVLLDQADEIVALHPDAVLIYTGHNEYYGVFGAGSTSALGGSRTVVRAYLALRPLRILQLLERALGAGGGVLATREAAGAAGAAGAPQTVMELMAGGQRVPLGSARYERGVAQFRANLDALLARYAAARIPVYVGTLVSNERDQAPLVSGFAPGVDSTAWRRRYAQGLAALRGGDTAAAETALRAAVHIDTLAADGLYALGRLYDARGDPTRARPAYRAAKERDELRFRAPEAMNDVIRKAAARHGATVVETQRAVERASPGGIPGGSLILEHLHPNVDGYFVLADAFYEALRQTSAFGAWPTPEPTAATAAEARRVVPVTAVDSLAGLLRTDRLRAGWPFQPRGVTVVPAVDTLRPRTPVEQLAQALVRGTMPWAEATDRLRAADEQSGDADGAIRAADALAREYRYSPQPYLDAARIALAHHRYADGLRWARAANERRETASSTQLVGLLLLQTGDQPGGVGFLERAAQLAPSDARTRGALAAARILPYLQASHERAPRDTTALHRLAEAYVLTQQLDRARATLDTLLAIAPAHAAGRALRDALPR